MDILSYIMGRSSAKGGGGGGSLPAGLYYEPIDIAAASSYSEVWVMIDGERYVFQNGYSGAASVKYVYKMDDTNRTKTLMAENDALNSSNAQNCQYLEYNGKIHFAGNYVHCVYDGSALTRLNDLTDNPENSTGGNILFTQGGKLKARGYSTGKISVWDESTDTWTEEASLLGNYKSAFFFTINDTVYCIYKTAVYTYDGASLTDYDTLGTAMSSVYLAPYYKDGYLYFGKHTNYLRPGEIYKYDIANKVLTLMGYMPFSNTEHRGRFWEYNGKLAVQFSNSKGVTTTAFYVNEVTE